MHITLRFHHFPLIYVFVFQVVAPREILLPASPPHSPLLENAKEVSVFFNIYLWLLLTSLRTGCHFNTLLRSTRID